MSDIITIDPLDGVAIALDPSAREAAQNLVLRAVEIEEVRDTLDADLAADVVRDITKHLSAIESARKQVKAPVLELGKRIDAVAANHVAPLEAHKRRVGTIAAGFIGRQRAEREAAEREAREAERARLAALAAEQAVAPDVDTQAENAARAAADIGVIRAEVQAVTVPKGAGVRKTQRFEVTDEAALLAYCPGVFSPDEVKIRAFIKTLRPGETIPGLRLWVEETLSVR